ncbi:MAG TPA: hypothetical protein VI855_05245 [Dehalococcoidia bacterium]|nr:hypothetical protein [Dehalococcoidia bacterium]
MEQQPTEAHSGTIPHCHWHPEVETRLSCSRCNKPVCPQCVVQAPVGLRCRDCGRATRMPTYDVRPAYLARAVAAAAGVAIGGGILWWVVNASFLGRIPFVSPLFAVAVGYAAGELISRATNRKRGTTLAWMAGGAVVAAFLISWLLLHFQFGIWGLLFIAAGIFVAVQRVR